MSASTKAKACGNCGAEVLLPRQGDSTDPEIYAGKCPKCETILDVIIHPRKLSGPNGAGGDRADDTSPPSSAREPVGRAEQLLVRLAGAMRLAVMHGDKCHYCGRSDRHSLQCDVGIVLREVELHFDPTSPAPQSPAGLARRVAARASA